MEVGGKDVGAIVGMTVGGIDVGAGWAAPHADKNAPANRVKPTICDINLLWFITLSSQKWCCVK
jgi:hypothetical protein